MGKSVCVVCTSQTLKVLTSLETSLPLGHQRDDWIHGLPSHAAPRRVYTRDVHGRPGPRLLRLGLRLLLLPGDERGGLFPVPGDGPVPHHHARQLHQELDAVPRRAHPGTDPEADAAHAVAHTSAHLRRGGAFYVCICIYKYSVACVRTRWAVTTQSQPTPDINNFTTIFYSSTPIRC